VITTTQVGIIGAGPAGLVLAHMLAARGIESVVLEVRDRSYVEHRVRAGVLEHPSVELLRDLGLAGRLDREGLAHRGIELAFEGRRHRLDFLELTGRSITVYGQQEDYPNALAIMQLAYGAGLVTEDSEIRRLADLLLFNDVPYRGAQVLEAGIEKKALKDDDKLYEKLANCWIAAGELEKSIPPLQRAAELSSTGDMFVRLGEVNVQREQWTAAQAALDRGISKGQLKDAGNAQLLMGIVLFNQKKYAEAKPWFERASQSEKHRQMSRGYLQLIQANA